MLDKIDRGKFVFWRGAGGRTLPHDLCSRCSVLHYFPADDEKHGFSSSLVVMAARTAPVSLQAICGEVVFLAVGNKSHILKFAHSKIVIRRLDRAIRNSAFSEKESRRHFRLLCA